MIMRGLYKLTCQRCGYKWKAYLPDPKGCARCKSPAWNKPKKKGEK